MGDEMISDEGKLVEGILELPTFPVEFTVDGFNDYIVKNKPEPFMSTVRYLIEKCTSKMFEASRNYKQSCNVWLGIDCNYIITDKNVNKEYLPDALKYVKKELEKEPRNFKVFYDYSAGCHKFPREITISW